MSTPKVYVVCDQNCRWESMTKEQILAAITQAVENHQITDVDTGFVTTIKTVNGIGLKFFVGTQAAWAEYPSDQKDGVFAIFSNDTTGDAIKADIEELQTALENILNGTQPVGKATATDFSNAEWISVAADGYAEIVQNGVYQIRVKVFANTNGERPRYITGIVSANVANNGTPWIFPFGTYILPDDVNKNYLVFHSAIATITSVNRLLVEKQEITLFPTYAENAIKIKTGNTQYGWEYRRIR